MKIDIKESEDIKLIQMTFDSVNDEESHLPVDKKYEIVQEALEHGYHLKIDIEKIKSVLENKVL